MVYILKPGQTIYVGGADGRRFRVYKQYLTRLGFRQTQYMNKPAMMFTRPSDNPVELKDTTIPFKMPMDEDEFLMYE